MQVQHTHSGDTGAESVVYTYLLSRGCSEERHYGTESVKASGNPVGIFHGSGYRACFWIFLGLRAAEMTALPPSIIQEAKTITSRVNQQLLVWLRKIGFGLFVLQ